MKYKLLSGLLITLSSFAYAGGGFGIGSTRIIFDGNQEQAKFVVNNGTENSDYLVQTWVDNKGPAENQEEVTKAPFIVTPPLVKSVANSKNELRVVSTGAQALPQDRESVFWVNVKAIPRVHDTASGNSMNIAVKSRIKLFYRPSNVVNEYAEGNDGYEQLMFSYADKKLVIKNPSPFYVSLFELKVDGVKVDTGYDMVPPKGQVQYSLSGKGASHNKVTWKAINDFGAITEEKAQDL
ncbi:molecular chaperone [Vibrio parahaemolyticus]